MARKPDKKQPDLLDQLPTPPPGTPEWIRHEQNTQPNPRQARQAHINTCTRCDLYPGNRHYTVAVTDLRQAYHIWCAEEGLEPVKGRAFASQLKVHGVLVGRDAPPQINSGPRLYGGLQLKDSDIW